MCGFCGGQFADAADESGVNVTVAESSVVVRVHENGSAAWTVRNRLSSGSEPFREESELLETTASRLATDHDGLPEEPSFVSARMDGDTAVLVYHDSDAATRHAGLLVVDYLHDGGHEPWYHVNAERFTVRGPEGTVVANTPESGAVEGRNATWTGGTGDGYYGSGADLEGSPYVVFGPDGSAGTTVRTAAALGLATLPIVRRSLQQFALFQTATFAAGLGTVLVVLRRWSPEPTPERLGGLLAGLGLLGVVGPVVDRGFALDGATGPPVFALGLGLLVWNGRLRERLRDVRSQALLAAGLLAVVLVVLAPLYALGTRFDRPLFVAVERTVFAVPLAVMLPLGAVLDDDRRAVRWWLLAVVGFLTLVVAMVNPADPPSGLGAGLAMLFLFGLALVGPLVGVPVVVLGRRLAATREEATGDGRTTAAPAD
ncbi:hypothetical protein BRC93_13435 [Halobacteriales archaeon QS_5_70_15]|nr:MAG: hypothetical protein BRC93_13435 [Halobacteriales archaeon QS_5_70_15]